MLSKIIILFLCVISSGATGQKTSNLDNLIQKLSTAKDTGKVQLLLTLSRKFSQSNTKKSIKYGKEALVLSKNLDYTRGTLLSLSYLAHTYTFANDRPQALRLQMELLSVAKAAHNLRREAAALQAIGNTFNFLGEYPQALKYLFQALAIYDDLGTVKKSAIVLSNIGKVYKKQENDSSALKYLSKSLKLLEGQNEKDYGDLTIVANSIALFYEDRNKPDKSLEYFEKALAYARSIPSEYNAHAIAMVLTNIGFSYESRQDYEQALAYNKKTFGLAIETNNLVLLGLSYQNRARIYNSMSSFEKSTGYYLKADSTYAELNMANRRAIVQNAITENYILLKNFGEATRYAKRSLETANRANIPEEAEKALKSLVIINKEIGNYEKAMKFQQQYQSIKDTLFNREKANQIALMQILYHTQENQDQIQLLEARAERGKTLRFLLISGFVALLIIGFLIYNQERIRRRKNEALFESNQALVKAELENTRMHETQLQQEIVTKNKELTTYALNFVQKNQVMDDLKQKIRGIRKNAEGEILQHLNGLQQAIGHSLNLDQDWDEFRLYFEQVHHQFFKELNGHFPDLSNKELRLCALLKLNLSSKEMATILGISPGSVKMARYRLRKKLNLESEDGLTAFLINLEKEIS